jgi:hypothetical protein
MPTLANVGLFCGSAPPFCTEVELMLGLVGSMTRAKRGGLLSRTEEGDNH